MNANAVVIPIRQPDLTVLDDLLQQRLSTLNAVVRMLRSRGLRMERVDVTPDDGGSPRVYLEGDVELSEILFLRQQSVASIRDEKSGTVSLSINGVRVFYSIKVLKK